MSSVSSSDDQFILVYSGSKSGLVHVPYIIRRYAIVLYDLPGTLIVLIDPPEILRSLALRMELFLKFLEIAVVLQKTRAGAWCQLRQRRNRYVHAGCGLLH